jgi:hypothetical protein
VEAWRSQLSLETDGLCWKLGSVAAAGRPDVGGLWLDEALSSPAFTLEPAERPTRRRRRGALVPSHSGACACVPLDRRIVDHHFAHAHLGFYDSPFEEVRSALLCLHRATPRPPHTTTHTPTQTHTHTNTQAHTPRTQPRLVGYS